GGSDQWSNIVAGVDLIRRVEGKDKPAFGLTFNLLLTSDGKKMGKTMDGTLWLNGQKTHPNDFYQYFRNLPDTDIKKCLLMLTFLPMDEIEELCAEEGAAMNRAKEVLAFEVTKIVHGEQEAQNARDDLKSFAICAKDFGEGMNIMDVLVLTGLEKSKSDARRSVQQGGASAGGEKIADIGHMVRPQDLDDGKIIIQKGKKKVLIVVS
ncbi:MAG: tyrosine--tRNA ligase, partial [Defluviitaleaceae bacterium]|nr:tyrosine--tRNA ligase [Defluviitaleaceae bacterium]